MDVDGVNAVIVGTVLWVAGLLYCLARLDTLRDQGRTWLLWTCVAGVALGFLGLLFTLRRRAAYRAAGDHSAGDHSAGDHSVS